MRRNGHKTTSGVKFDPKFDFSVPYFIPDEILEIGPRFYVSLANFLLRICAETPEFYLRSNF